MRESSLPRRSFLAAVATAAGATALTPLFSGAEGRLEAAEASAAPWDLSWLDKLEGKHRQVFEIGKKIEDVPGPLHVVGNYLDAWRDVYRLEFPQINTIVGIAGTGFPINVNDSIWAKYKVGEKWQIPDESGKSSASHNVFLESPASDTNRASVKGLQARGTIFTQCNNALRLIAKEFALAAHDTVDNVYAELVAGLNPGVRLVPANTMLIGLAQEHGCAYESV